jgi:hypothetical protein
MILNLTRRSEDTKFDQMALNLTRRAKDTDFDNLCLMNPNIGAKFRECQSPGFYEIDEICDFGSIVIIGSLSNFGSGTFFIKRKMVVWSEVTNASYHCSAAKCKKSY